MEDDSTQECIRSHEQEEIRFVHPEKPATLPPNPLELADVFDSALEYAAAFFLLADHLQDAVSVCLNQLKDLQLAVTIARVYEGDQGPVLRKLLEDEVLAIAAQDGNRWLASWAFWMLHRRDMAVRALIVSICVPPPTR